MTKRGLTTIHCVGLCSGIIAGLSFIYLLSYGAIIFLDERDAFSSRVEATLDSAYKPAGRVAASRSVAGQAFRAYLRFWTKGHYFDERNFND